MKILAAVVTHNRCELLRRCIDHLQAQDRPPDAILVINNGSTDGTVDMLRLRGIDFVTQENVGSAGGWYTGIAAAMQNGYDAVWLMDDDGFPDSGALGKLERALVPGVACASSVVLCENDPARFVFPFPKLDAVDMPVIVGLPRKFHTRAELRAVVGGNVYPFAHFFNGALLDVDAARKVGNVNRDFFIYGDEVDYFFRLREAGRVLSILDAVHLHPDVAERPFTPVKTYYYIKNSLILNRRYHSAVWARHVMTIVAALARVARRNGAREAISYVIGRNARSFAFAITRGLSGKVGKDFHG